MTQESQTPDQMELVEAIINGAQKALELILKSPLTVEYRLLTVELNYLHVRSIICHHFGITKELLEHPGKIHTVATARVLYCYLCSRYLSMNYAAIARTIKRDRTTILKNLKSVEGLIKNQDAHISNHLPILISKIEALTNEKIQTTSQPDNAERA